MSNPSGGAPKYSEMKDTAGAPAAASAAPPAPPAHVMSPRRVNPYGISPELKKVFLGFVVLQFAFKDTEVVTETVHKLRGADLRTQVFYSSKRDAKGKPTSVFVKVYASAERLLIEADNVDQKFLLDPHKLRKADVMKNLELQSEGLRFNPEKPRPDPHNPARLIFPEPIERDDLAIPSTTDTIKVGDNYDAYAHHYAPYDVPETAEEAQADQLFYVWPDTKCILSSRDAINMLLHVMEEPDDGAGLNLDAMVAKKKMTNYFVLHDKRKEALEKAWFVWCAWPWQQPLDQIRDYFGEKVGMYFAFLGMYTQWLAFPAILGVAMFIHQLGAEKISVSWLPIYGLLIALWITFFLEFWKRLQSKKAMEWGMADFKAEENLRPEYIENPKVTMIRSYVNGKPVYWDSPTVHTAKVSTSFSIITTMAGIVIVAVLSIFTLRVVLVELEDDGKIEKGWGGILASVINALQIQIMNLVYMTMAEKLNDWENHKTDTAYENSLITKVCLFQFINSYISLFYIAFMKNQVEVFGRKQECDGNDCLNELRTQLAVIFITRLVVGNTVELLVPKLKSMWASTFYKKLQKDDAGEDLPMSATEQQSFLAPYEPFEDYLELLIQFGYASLFVVAFPVAPLLALITNYFELRVDSYKLLNQAARPAPIGAQDIGSWYGFLEIIGYFAVFTNLGVVIFTDKSDFFGQDSTKNKLVSFVLLEHIVFFLKFIGDRFIPDSSLGVDIQLARSKYLIDKHMRFIRDEIPEQVEAEPEAVLAQINPLHGGDAKGDGEDIEAKLPKIDIAANEEQAAKVAAYNDLLMLQRAGAVNAPAALSKREKAAQTGAKVVDKAKRKALAKEAGRRASVTSAASGGVGGGGGAAGAPSADDGL